MENQVKKSKASLVLGIISLVAWLIPIIGIIVSGVGTVLSIKQLKVSKCKGYKIALVLNIIGIIATVANSAIGVYIMLNRG